MDMDINSLTEEDIKNMSPEELQTLEMLLEEPGGNYGGGSPMPEKKDSQLQLFRDIIKTKDTTKLGNLKNEDLGKARTPVRSQLEVAHYFDAEGITPLGDYLRQKAELTLATSLSHKATLLQSIITQIKKEIKGAVWTPQKKKLFGGFGKDKAPEISPITGGQIE